MTLRLTVLSAKCHYAECRIFIIMPSAIMLSVIMLSVIMLSVAMLSVIMLSVVAPFLTRQVLLVPI
jgi:hypothetical protein